jgi:FMN phosphatase YigB (HAD superfamily)
LKEQFTKRSDCKISNSVKKTIVFDLDETLIHVEFAKPTFPDFSAEVKQDNGDTVSQL